MKALIVRNLNFQYPDGRAGLNGVNLELEQGMKVALVGRNGCGKTTFLLHINGLLDGDGHLEVMNTRRSRKTIKEIRKRVGFLFSQVEYQFIMPDLRNDIILSLSETADTMPVKEKTAMDWLRRFGLEQLAGYHPLDLSSGEMKRAALAAILAKKPDILLLDEPLNNLDRENSLVLISLLKSLDNTMIMATHRRLLVEELATHIAVMEGGTVTGFYDVKKGLKMEKVKSLIY